MPRDKQKPLTEVVTSDLRVLLFWANVGKKKCKGGYRYDEIGDIVESYAKHIKFNPK